MTSPARLDVALAVRRVASVFWLDFTPIVVLGFVMVTLPRIVQQLVGSHSGSTIVATFGGMLNVFYVVIVIVGALARLTAKPLATLPFARAGVTASPLGLSTAMLLGAGVVAVLVALLLAGLTAYGGIVRGLLVTAAVAALVVALPAVPAAIVERLSPIAALRRAGRLTRGNRGRIAALVLVCALIVVPLRFVLTAVVYGTASTSAQAAAVTAAMTMFSPGLWLLALYDLLAWGIAAVVPAVIYIGLVERR